MSIRFSAPSYWSSPPPEPADWPPGTPPMGSYNTCLWDFSAPSYWSSPEPADWPPASTPLAHRWALITHVYGIFSTLLLILSSAWASGLAAREHSAGPALGPYNTCLWDFQHPSDWSSPPPEPADWPSASTPLAHRWALITQVYRIFQHPLTDPLFRLSQRTGRPWALRWPTAGPL